MPRIHFSGTGASAALAGALLLGAIVPLTGTLASERSVIRSETAPQRGCGGPCERGGGAGRDALRGPGLLPSLDLRNRDDAYGGAYRDGFRDGLRAGLRGRRGAFPRGGGVPPIDPGRFTWVDGVPFLDVPAGAEYHDGPHFQYGDARTGRGGRCNRSGGHFHGVGGQLIVRWR